MMKVCGNDISVSYIFTLAVAILHSTGIARIVTDPADVKFLYFNHSTHNTIICKNRSENNNKSSIVENSVWFRILPNTTQPHRFDGSLSKRVRIYNQLLAFPSPLSSDEGEYYCCAPAGKPCSDPLPVYTCVQPVIKALSKTYTAFIGSEVNLICVITNEGKPFANFRWTRSREDKSIPEDFMIITTNNTHTVLKLTNLTQQSSGGYYCIAESQCSSTISITHLHLLDPPKMSGPRIAHAGGIVNITCVMLEGQSFPDIYISTPLGNVYKTQSISFAATLQHTGYYKCSANTSAATDIKNHYLLVYEIDNTTSFIRFQAIIIKNDCHFNKYDTLLSTARVLREHIFELCGCDVSISTEGFECISNGSAIYDVKLTGYMAANIKQFLLDEYLRIKIASGGITLYVCDPLCGRSTSDNNQLNNEDNKLKNNSNESTNGNTELNNVSDETDHRIIISIWMASSALILLFAIIVIYLTYKFCKHAKLIKFLTPRQETNTDATPNPYTSLARRHQNTVLHHGNDVLPPHNIAAVESHEEQAVEALNNPSSIENNHPVNCNPKSEKDQTINRGSVRQRDNLRSMQQYQELSSGFSSTKQASVLTCNILNFTENSPTKNDRMHTDDGKVETQSEMYQTMTNDSSNTITAGMKKESSV